MESQTTGLYGNLGLTHNFDDSGIADKSGHLNDIDVEKGELSGREVDFIGSLLEEDDNEASSKQAKPPDQPLHDDIWKFPPINASGINQTSLFSFDQPASSS